jgi:hypothetical protein
MLLAEGCHLSNASNGELRLAGTRPVVQPAVQHATVVAGLMAAHARFFFDKRQSRAGRELQDLLGRRETDSTTTHHDDSSLTHIVPCSTH